MQTSRRFYDKLNSEELLKAIAEGNEDAYSSLFTMYYAQLFSYACRIMNDRNEAEECVQSTFCHIWDIHGKLEIRDSLKSYLFRSVYNNCITRPRQRKALAKYEESGQLDLYFARVVQNPQAEMRLIDSETRREILRTIASLPERCREIFVKCKIEGKTYAEVAENMDISVKTVENQMTIAYKKLREKLSWLLLIYL
jgi:RNA polymerase sigma-70 factor (ECF subfamily)